MDQLDFGESIREGVLIRKNVMDSAVKRSSNRQWKAYFIVATNDALYVYKSEAANKTPKERKPIDAILLRHAVASVIQGYSEERPFVFSFQAHTGALIYFQVFKKKEVIPKSKKTLKH